MSPREKVRRKYQWNPKWNKDPNYNCTTCKNLGEAPMIGSFSTHWGCYFNGRYQRWVPQKLAKRKAVCTVSEERGKFPSADVHWQPIQGADLPVVAKPLEHPERQSKLA